MAKSLQEQLMQAGLVNTQKAKSIKQEKRKASKQTPKVKKGESLPTPLEQAAQRKIEQQAKDRARSMADSVKRRRQECTAQIRQLVEANLVKHGRAAGLREDDEVVFQFVDNKKIKQVRVDKAQQSALERGRLAIVLTKGLYQLVPGAVALRIVEREQSLQKTLESIAVADVPQDPVAAESVVVLCNRTDHVANPDPASSADDTDDPYADYQIPDDLMW